MKNNIKKALSDKGIGYALIFSFILLVLQVGLVSLEYLKLPPLVPLFNSLSWGNDRLAFRVFVFFVPLLLLSMGIFNIGIAASFYKKHILLSRMLSYNLLLCAVLSTIAVVQVLFLVF